jgi:L-seryl-tRNA(Ser) seleniumtransferase
MLRRDFEAMRSQAENLAEELSRKVHADVKVIEVEDATGGGSCPEIELNGFGVSIKHKYGVAHIQKILRNLDIPILCGAREDEIIFHVRTLQDGDEDFIISSLERILNA